MTESKTLFVSIKGMEKSGEHAFFKGSFSTIASEIKKGNKLAGIALADGKIGFVFNDEPDMPESASRACTIGQFTGLLDKEGKEVFEKGTSYVYRMVMCHKDADDLLPEISKKVGADVDELRRTIFIAGMNELLADMKKAREAEEGNIITRIFKR